MSQCQVHVLLVKSTHDRRHCLTHRATVADARPVDSTIVNIILGRHILNHLPKETNVVRSKGDSRVAAAPVTDILLEAIDVCVHRRYTSRVVARHGIEARVHARISEVLRALRPHDDEALIFGLLEPTISKGPPTVGGTTSSVYIDHEPRGPVTLTEALRNVYQPAPIEPVVFDAFSCPRFREKRLLERG